MSAPPCEFLSERNVKMSVYKLRYGVPEQGVPTDFSPAPLCEVNETAPEGIDIGFSVRDSGCVFEFKLQENSEVYGFGLQLKGFGSRSRKRHIRPNADPPSNTGESHAPVPFFVTTEGWGVYIDTARYVEFYCGFTKKDKGVTGSSNGELHTDFADIYADRRAECETVIAASVPVAHGADIYIITGENILDIVSQYNLLAGGGCEVPLWGLGNQYRCHLRFSSAQVLSMAGSIRSLGIPCDVIGLEPGWQSNAYSCSFVWDKTRFPDWREMCESLKTQGFKVNLWEHAFTHPTSPLHSRLGELSGDYTVWGGLVPDFALEEAKNVFADYHAPMDEAGVKAYKLDECDGSDYTGHWTFPNCAQFPSGLDGERYHNLFGILYGQAMLRALTQRTYGQVRNSGALAASYPYALYSDLYSHEDFIRGVATSGFSGLLWSPEVRHAESREDMIRRVQTVVFSPQSLINAFYLESMPWVELGCTDEIRRLLELRMSLIPYLYTAFEDYRVKGRPPVRALVCDCTEQTALRDVWNEYFFGDDMIVAPMTAAEHSRRVVLPEGDWYGFFDGRKYSGTFDIETEEIPVFVRSGSIIPLAAPVDHVAEDTVFELTLCCYGDTSGSVARIVEDDGVTRGAERRVITLHDYTESVESFRYRIVGRRRTV